MGYIKKLKNNELVGGTDKTTIYPVTSAEAVFEEVIEDGESNFKSQKFLNNNITGDRINEGTITDYNIATGTITKGKFTSQVQTMLDEGQKKALTPKGNYDSDTEYEALDLVFDPVTNSSYISLQTPNVGHPVDENAEGYEEGWWEKTLDGTAVNTAQAAINNKVDQLNTQVNNAIGQANQDIQDLIDASQEALQAATDEANDAAGEARDAASTVESLTSQQVADAQIGYFTCTNAAASGAAANETKITTTDTIGESHYVKTIGSHVKVKMAAANTHAAPVYLQFGSNTATRSQVYYNGAAVGASNSWEDGEVITVYFDGINYQASNALGGGSAVGKKKLTGIKGRWINTSGNTVPTTTTADSAYTYIKYPVNPGDVIMISGKGGNSPRLWAIADEENNILSKSDVNLTTVDLVLVMPDEAKWIVLNNDISVYPDYKWYYAKKGSVGAHEMLTEAYLYDNLRVFSVGQIYKKDESVKTEDKQFRKVTKDIEALSLYETLATGDLRINSNATYRAASAVDIFDPNPSTPYSADAYVLGSVTEYTLTVNADSVTAGNITVNGTEVVIETTDDATTIAAKIADALVIDGWTTSAAENVVTVRCDTIGNNTTSITITDTDSTGVEVVRSSIAGTNVIRKYDGEVWANATPAAMIEDGILEEVNEAWLIVNATEENSITKELTRTRNVILRADKLTQGRFLQANSGSAFNTLVSANSSYHVTNYMDCSGADRISIFCTRSTTCKYCGVIFYDRNYTPIKTIVNTTSDDHTYKSEVPKNAVYVRTTTWSDPYCGSLTYIDKIKDISISNEKRISAAEQNASTIDTRLENVEEELEEKLEPNELIDYSTLVTAAHEANMRVTVDTVNNSIEFYSILAAASKRGALYFPSNMIVGRKYKITFDYSCNGTGDRWFGISDNYTAPTLSYPWAVHLENTSNGHLELTLKYASNMKLFAIGSNSLNTNKYLILRNLSIKEDLNFKSIQDQLGDLEDTLYDIPSHVTPYKYNGEPLSFKTHKFGSELYMNISLTGTGQGGTNYGDFYFVGTSNGVTFNVFNLKTKTKLGTFNVEAPSISNCHCNTLTFSNQFYEAGDEFPVLYVCSGYGTGNNPTRFCVYGYRIINNEGVFSATLVHTITLTASTGSWTEFIIDNESQQAFIKLDGKWYKRTMPTISGGDITINMDNLEYISVQPAAEGSPQGHMFYKGKIYFTADDLNTSGIHHLYVYDVFTGRYSAVIDTVSVYNAETENVFIYDEHLFIGYRGRIYKLYFE